MNIIVAGQNCSVKSQESVNLLKNIFHVLFIDIYIR